MKSYGNKYILETRAKKVIFPQKGEIYDFINETLPVWVCGEPYSTTANGDSSPIDVAGKKIKILSVSKGDAHNFSVIEFEEKKKYCHNCGNSVSASVCGSCGYFTPCNEDIQLYCVECGYELTLTNSNYTPIENESEYITQKSVLEYHIEAAHQ